MLDTILIRRLFEALNQELKARETIGEVGICGGAVMCLVFQARQSTKDVDAVFAPTRQIREAAAQVADQFHVPKDWLNDAAKGFFHSEPPRQDVLSLSHLRVWAPTAEYMLAMKCVSARFDSHDRDDVVFLIRHLGFHKKAQVFDTVSRFYPRQLVPAKTQFLVEEIFDGLNSNKTP